MMQVFLSRLEALAFRHRLALLLALLGFTVLMAVFALQLRMEAGFEKQLPTRHEYIETFQKYRSELFGANRLTVVVHAREGDIWSEEGLRRLFDVTEALAAMQGVNRASVTSLWTPNVFVTETTEEGFSALPVTGGDLTPDRLDAAVIGQIRERAVRGGHIGTLVANDHRSVAITAELIDRDLASGEPLDYIAFNRALEEQLRAQFEDADFEIQIIGFVKQIGDIAEQGKAAVPFFILAFFLTAAAVYWYCRSAQLTLLPLACSLVSLVWQFGTLRLLGYGLDPLAILVPFLVFAIGVSHGVQQINYIVREIAHGKTSMQAARASFSGLLIPGTLALVTAFVSFITLVLVPIPMIQELAITASIGVGYKIITNLIMLPVAASYVRVSPDYARQAMLQRERRSQWLHGVARLAEPGRAAWVTLGGLLVLGLAIWGSQGRHVGSLEPGAPELRADARFNQDAAAIVAGFNVGLDWLTVVIATEQNACENASMIQLVDDLGWALKQVPGVVAVESAATVGKEFVAALNEGNPKMASLPRDGRGIGGIMLSLPKTQGIRSADCSMQAVNLYLTDHKATTIKAVLQAVKAFSAANQLDGVAIRLASGNAGVAGATNEVLEESELPMMLYVYACIVALVFLTYRDWRAVLSCCLPLTVATWIGYWFMKELNIGLTVATLPVMVLAVGIGVDYAFYIYNRFQLHLAAGQSTAKAVEHAILETGIATIFTALTLTVGVATWSFSQLKFQADMGKLLAFMFMINMVMAMTLLPAFAVTLDRLFPRRGPVRVPGIAHH